MNVKNETIIAKKLGVLFLWRTQIKLVCVVFFICWSSLICPVLFNVSYDYQAIRVLGLGSHFYTKASVTFVSSVITLCVQWLKACAITLCVQWLKKMDPNLGHGW